jgi:GT2 family glycosyltransferase
MPTAVVIPCFNLGRFVEEAIESVVAQTRPPAEVVVVDDGSTDSDTLQILRELERPRTRVVRTPNRGLAAARNHGIRLTSAPYIFTLDADDMLEATYVERTAGRLDAEPALDFVTTAIRAFGGAAYLWTPPACDVGSALTRGGPHPATIFRRRVWAAVGGFDEVSRIPGVEDLDFWITAMERGFRGEVLAEPLMCYRVRADSMHHDAVERGTHPLAMETLLRKHRRAIEQIGPEMLIMKESFLLELRGHQRALERKRAKLAAELRALEVEIADTARAPVERGWSPVALGDLRRLEPVSSVWGLDRGKPIDRHYIEAFLASHRSDIRGRVLEVKDPGYTELFGSAAVTARDVLDIDPSNQRATIVADLSRADGIASDQFDCFILTQTLHIIYDVKAALAQACRILRPGGVLLCTLPAVSRVNYEDGGLESGDYWRFTEASVRRLLAEIFPPENVDVTVRGNVLTCAAFLYGLAADELETAELEHVDRWFPLLFCVRAVKSGS